MIASVVPCSECGTVSDKSSGRHECERRNGENVGRPGEKFCVACHAILEGRLKRNNRRMEAPLRLTEEQKNALLEHIEIVKKIVTYCSRRVPDHRDDMLQHVTFKLCRSINSFRGNVYRGEEFEVTLRALSRIFCKDYFIYVFSKYKYPNVLAENETIDGEDSPGWNYDSLDFVRHCIALTDPRGQRILTLKFVHGYETGDIAKMVGLSRASARNWIARGCARLREQLKDLL